MRDPKIDPAPGDRVEARTYAGSTTTRKQSGTEWWRGCCLKSFEQCFRQHPLT